MHYPQTSASSLSLNTLAGEEDKRCHYTDCLQGQRAVP
jgi:hypothetical protein